MYLRWRINPLFDAVSYKFIGYRSFLNPFQECSGVYKEEIKLDVFVSTASSMTFVKYTRLSEFVCYQKLTNGFSLKNVVSNKILILRYAIKI